MIKDLLVKEIESQPMLSIRAQTVFENIGPEMGKLFPRIMGYITKIGAKPAGMPLALYHHFGSDGVDMECAIPMAHPVEGSGDIVTGNTPSGKVAVATYIGPYTRLMEAYDALEEWMKAEGLTPNGPPWEVYVTDPGAEPDSSKWQTDVYYLVD